MTTEDISLALVGALMLIGLLSLPALITFQRTQRPGIRALSVALPLTPVLSYLVFILIGSLLYGPNEGRGLYPQLAMKDGFVPLLVLGLFHRVIHRRLSVDAAQSTSH